ncbi:MAG: thermonuclease family protein [Patescibacteria group bacterium]|jgi:endonuclease YncB( thermonuclease family)
MGKKLARYFVYIALVPTLLLNTYFFIKNSSNVSDSGVYIRDVIDGDTLVTETGSRIRLLRADAPDLVYCLGKEAKDRLYELVVGKRVLLKDQSGDSFGLGLC